jgi:hypothetical protein
MSVGDYQENAFGSRLYNQGLYEESATQKHRLGTIRETDDGRRFVYCQATAADLTAGCVVSKAVAAQDCTIAAADAAINLAGVRKITVTLTGTPTLNLYRDGHLIITAGTGIGEYYKIKGNTADDNPASGRCTLYLYDALKTTHVAASTTISIFANPYDGVLINPAVADGDAVTAEAPLGVTQRPVTASYYFWAQTRGLGSCVLDVSTAGNEADEKRLIQGTTAGRLLVAATTAEEDQPVYGRVFESADMSDGEASLVELRIM